MLIFFTSNQQQTRKTKQPLQGQLRGRVIVVCCQGPGLVGCGEVQVRMSVVLQVLDLIQGSPVEVVCTLLLLSLLRPLLPASVPPHCYQTISYHLPSSLNCIVLMIREYLLLSVTFFTDLHTVQFCLSKAWNLQR